MNETRTLIIRETIDADYAQWRPLWDDYNAFYGRKGMTALSEDIVRTTWRRFFDPDEQVFCLVAEHQGKLVGLAHYVFHRNTITIEDTCYLQDLFAAPEMRGMGVGRALISTFCERAGQAGIAGVYWHTQSSNQTAMRLYDKVAENTAFVVYRKSVSSDGNA